jgi:hypothetical protein
MNILSRIKKIEQICGTKKDKPVSKVVIIYDATKPLPKANDTGVTIFIPDNFRDKAGVK